MGRVVSRYKVMRAVDIGVCGSWMDLRGKETYEMIVLHRLRSILVLACTLILICVTCLQTCNAQVRRYQPQTPTLSPYLNLTLANRGGLPNYYAFVRPELHQQALNQREQALTRQQGQTIQRLENDVQRGTAPIAETGTGSWFMTYGTRSPFLDTSNYYPEIHLRGRGR
jgi:hypothetical protein